MSGTDNKGAGWSMEALLLKLGLGVEADVDVVDEVVTEYTRRTGVPVTILSRRNNVLLLSSTPAGAALLKYDSDALLQTIQAKCGRAIARIRIVSR